MTSGECCVPLCGATKAYGVWVKWWHHEPQCPARKAQRAADELTAPWDGEHYLSGEDT